MAPVTVTGATTTSGVSPDQMAAGFAKASRRHKRKREAPADVESAADARTPGDAAEDAGDGSGSHFIKGAIRRPGSLHRALGVPLGSKISQAQLGAALKSTSPDVRKKARFAKELAKLRK